MCYYEEVKSVLYGMVHHRFSEKELTDRLSNLFRVVGLNLSEHFIDGKEESPNEIYDDKFSFDLENEFGDMFVDVYYIKTNEGDYYITETYFDHDDWKVRDKRGKVE